MLSDTSLYAAVLVYCHYDNHAFVYDNVALLKYNCGRMCSVVDICKSEYYGLLYHFGNNCQF